jgi:hypothetical protein
MTTPEFSRNQCEVKVCFWGGKDEIKLFTTETYVEGHNILSMFVKNNILLLVIYT